jgi:predicted DsbA family dithiol-disulfide isomerase
MSDNPPVVRVWSDYICPFCYVATERAAWLEERYGALVEWLPFDLHPEYPAEGISIDELRAKYPSGLHDQVDRMIDEAGLPRGERKHVPNSRAALNVTELARENGVHEPLHARLMAAYWAEGRDIGDTEVLVEEAGAVGLDAGEVRAVIGENRYADRIAAATAALFELGGSGVPGWVVDDRVFVPGAQPHELFERVMQKLGHGGESES